MNRIMNMASGFVFALSTVVLALPAGAQTAMPAPASDQSSLADYARKVHKDPATTKARPKVYDNDNLPTDDKISVVGQPPVADAVAPPADADKDKDKDKDKDADRKSVV